VSQALLFRWLVAFAFTQIVEVPIYRRILGSRFWEAFGASAMTHPLLWFAFVPLVKQHLTYVQYAAIGEALVVIVEGLYFRLLFTRRRALVASLAANGASYFLALLSNALVNWP
jgi:hypothetical protein